MAAIDDINKIISEVSPYYKKKAEAKNFGEAPGEEHKLIYDSSSETLEPVYFWLVDFLGEGTEKLVDNFAASPGSGHFSELMMKATRMQEEGMKILGTVNTVIKSIMNIIYDLKEFEIRLDHYKKASSKNPAESEAGLLSLKQIWIDQVDIKRGQGSINALASGNLQFVTLRDAFMFAKSSGDVDKMDLNDRVKRILKPRVQEFFKWRELSEKELEKRYNIEKSYLKSQSKALQLYTRWARPYLKAAAELEQKEFGREPALVNAFNTIIFELTLLKKSEVKFQNAIVNKQLPRAFERIKLKRNYYSCVLVDFFFRGIPQRVGQHYAFGGRAEVTFRAYALNDDELKMLDQKLKDSDLSEALKLVSGMTEDSLAQIKDDIDYFLKEEKKEEEKKGEDPFTAIFNIFRKKREEKKKEEEIKEVKKDSYVEEVVRKLAEQGAKESCFSVFDIYKKGHGMASHPSPFD